MLQVRPRRTWSFSMSPRGRRGAAARPGAGKGACMGRDVRPLRSGRERDVRPVCTGGREVRPICTEGDGGRRVGGPPPYPFPYRSPYCTAAEAARGRGGGGGGRVCAGCARSPAGAGAPRVAPHSAAAPARGSAPRGGPAARGARRRGRRARPRRTRRHVRGRVQARTTQWKPPARALRRRTWLRWRLRCCPARWVVGACSGSACQAAAAARGASQRGALVLQQ